MRRLLMAAALAAAVGLTLAGPLFAEGETESAGVTGVPVSPAGAYPIVDEPLTVSAYFADYTSWADYSENNRALQFYAEKTNIVLDVVFGDKKVLFASGDYPEVFFTAGLNNQDLMSYADQGLLRPLNDLIDKYGTVFKQAEAEINPHLTADLTSPDGNIYGIPNIGGPYSAQTQKAYINVAWLEELGLDMPGTTDGFASTLRAFKDRDPDAVPYTGAIGTWWGDAQYFLVNPFMLADFQNGFLIVDGGELAMAAVRPEWRAGLQWANSLYEEGLIDPGAFTQNLEQLGMLGNNEEKPLLGVFTAGHLQMGISQADRELYVQYDTLPPLLGPNGTGYANWWDNTRASGAQFVMTDKAENPDAAFRYLDWWMSEEAFWWNWIGDKGIRFVDASPGQLTLYGEQAKVWDRRWDDDYENPIDEKLDAGRIVQTPQRPWHFWEKTMGVSEDRYAANWWTYDGVVLGGMTRKYEPFRSELNLPKSIGALWVDADTATEINQIKTALTDYINEHMVRFITGDLDVESDWDAYVSGVQNLQLETFLELVNAAYAAEDLL